MDQNQDVKQANKEDEFTIAFYSRSQLGSLLPWISKTLQDLGINNFPGDSYIQGADWNIRFYRTDYGCEFYLYAWKMNKEKFLASDLSRVFQYMVDKDRVWSNQYIKRSLSLESTEVLKTSLTKFWKPWEHMLGADEVEIDIVYLWCTTKIAQAELEKYLPIADGSFAVRLNTIRNKYNEKPYFANIPNGKPERNDFFVKWQIYLLQVPIEERQIHEKKMIKLLAEKLNKDV